MLETCLNQAAGLQGLALQASPKLIAIASHGDQQVELPLIWSLCSTWVNMGLAVAVLDGHAHESAENPGLLHLLADPLSHVSDDRDTAAWSVLPAASGLSDLTNVGFNSDTVGHCFQKFSVVVIYASAQVLSGLLKDSGTSPLLVVTPLKASSLTAYYAMKQLLLSARLHPTVANITIEKSNANFMPKSTQNLQDCAMSFLGLTVKPVTVTANSLGDVLHGEINRLALQLLESAVFFECQHTPRTH